MRIAFVHPDLGIGGAERLVVDAAVGLQQKGHDVIMYTSHHDSSHCFQETRDGTLKVIVRGEINQPRWLKGLHLPLAMLRNLWLCITVVIDVWMGRVEPYDIFVVDQLSVAIPILHLLGTKVFFYCHFPDKLLSARPTLLKQLYRIPFDFLEELTTRQADMIVSNSKFTAEVFQREFPSIKVDPQILYPCLNLESYDILVDMNDESVKPLIISKKRLLSINRFERKKEIDLAIRAFARLKQQLSQTEFGEYQLVIAGGYDTRVRENVEHHKELDGLARKLGLSASTFFGGKLAELQTRAFDVGASVIFVPSFTEKQRRYLLDSCIGLVYTPSNEHFGIVPLEAMYSQRLVIAMNSGGPRETVLHDKTGWLCEPGDEESVADAMLKLAQLSDAERASRGRLGRTWVAGKFSLETFANSLEEMLFKLHQPVPQSGLPILFTILFGVLCGIAVSALVMSWMMRP